MSTGTFVSIKLLSNTAVYQAKAILDTLVLVSIFFFHGNMYHPISINCSMGSILLCVPDPMNSMNSMNREASTTKHVNRKFHIRFWLRDGTP